MTRQDIDTIISIICPNDEDFEKACISPAYLKNELEILALDQEPCEDAISRKSMLDYIKYLHGEMPEEEFVKALPSVTPARKKGKWIVLKDEYGDICEAICSCCGDNGNHRWKYCPNCGAEMESEE